MKERLEQQLQFILEADKLKNIIRRNFLTDDSRRENTAEHSWHIALAAQILYEYRRDPAVDLNRVIRLLTIHDLVEIYAGDTFFFDEKGNQGKFDRELEACERLFSLLPADQTEEYKALWLEFEEALTPDGLFASAVDRIMPVLMNSVSAGTSWKEAGITAGQIRGKMENIRRASEDLGNLLEEIIQKSLAKGILKP